MLELYVFPLHRVADPLQPDLPGLIAVPPVKQGGHGRESDLLILYIALSRPDAFTSMALKQMLQGAADLYRNGHGTVTAGLRVMGEQLNSILLEFNLRNAQKAEPVLATLNLMALRENIVFLAQSGETHTFVIGPEAVYDYNDSLTGGRGLGFSSALNMKYYQVNTQPGDVVVFSPNPPPGWTLEALTGSHQLTLEHLRRRLSNQAGPDLQAVVIKFQLGSGQIHMLRPRLSQPPGQSPIPTPEPVPAPGTGERTAAAAPAEPAQAGPAPAEEVLPAIAEEPAPPPVEPGSSETQPVVPVTTGQPMTRAERLRLQHPRSTLTETAEAASAPPVQPSTQPGQAVRPPRRRGQGRRQMAAGWLGIKAFSQRIGDGFNTLTGRIAPVKTQKAAPLPASTMLFIAVAVPLMVVAVAVTVYFQSGRTEQRSTYYVKALEFAASAVQQPDLVLQANDWGQAEQWLNKADELGVTDESRTLRTRIQQSQDKAETIVRLDYKPINRFGFSSTTKITRIAANSSDIYLLDSSQGKVMRLFYTGSAYELDNQFRCSPGVSGNLQVGPLVDLVVLPPNSRKATVLALDASATLLYCIPGDRPAAVQLQSPDNGWGKPTAIALYQESLVILDQKDNAVWVYDGKDSAFANKPRLFFDKVVPTLGNVVDLAYYQDELYLLRSDNTITQCTASSVAFAPTRCKDPAAFGDARVGHDPSPTTLAGAAFIQVMATQPPDPSVYMLDAKGQGLYHFSLQLNLQRQLRPSYGGDSPPPNAAPSSFAITPTRLAILAYGSQVFYAQLP